MDWREYRYANRLERGLTVDAAELVALRVGALVVSVAAVGRGGCAQGSGSRLGSRFYCGRPWVIMQVPLATLRG